MTKRKWIYIALIVIIVVPIVYFYQAFNSDPVSKMRSKATLKSYLVEQYPEQTFQLDNGVYNFKIGGYSYQVLQIEGEQEYEFEVTGVWKPTVSYDGLYYDNLDEPLMMKLSEQATAEISDILEQEALTLLTVFVQVEVLNGSYDASTAWHKELVLEKPMHIDIAIDATGKAKADILEVMKSIQARLNDNGYIYDRVVINANETEQEEDGGEVEYVKYYGAFTQDQSIKLRDVEEN